MMIKMIKLILVILVCASIVAPSLAGLADLIKDGYPEIEYSGKIKTSYEKIEKYLARHSSLSNEEIMEIACKWFDKESQKTSSWIHNNVDLVEELKNFVNLKRADLTTKCSLDNPLLLVNNVLDAAPETSLILIKRITEYYARQNAIECQQVYIDTFRNSYDTLVQGDRKFDWMITLTDKFIEEYLNQAKASKSSIQLYSEVEQLYEVFVMGFESLTFSEDKVGKLIKDLVKKMKEEDKEKDWYVKQNPQYPLGEALARRYVLEPCSYYIITLGQDVFFPAHTGAIELRFSTEVKLDHDLIDYYTGFARYVVCHDLIYRNAEKIVLAEPLKDLS